LNPLSLTSSAANDAIAAPKLWPVMYISASGYLFDSYSRLSNTSCLTDSQDNRNPIWTLHPGQKYYFSKNEKSISQLRVLSEPLNERIILLDLDWYPTNDLTSSNYDSIT